MTDGERERAFNGTINEIIRGRTRLLTDTRDEIARYLKDALDRINAILAAQPTDYQQWSLPRLAKEIQQALAQFGEQATARISTAAGDAWQLGQDLVDKPLLAAGVHIEASLGAIDVRQLQAMRAFMTDRLTNVALEAANKINAELGLVVIGAQSPSDATSKVRLILGEQSRARATTIVRGEVGRAFAVASYQDLAASAVQVPALKKRWRKSGKLHPRLYHDLADGQVRDVKEPFNLGNGAKLMHPHDPAASAAETVNCGCVMLPYMESWKKDKLLTYPGRSPGGLDMDLPINDLLAA